MPSKSNSNTKSFISFNNTGDAPSLGVRDSGPPNLHARACVRECLSRGDCPLFTGRPSPTGGGTAGSPERCHRGCAAVLGDDESILLAGPQISPMQRWHGLNQQGLCVPAPCLQRQSRHLLCNAPLRYLRADGSLVPNAPEDLGFLLLSQLGPRFDSSSGAIRLGNVRNVLHVGRV